jgi:hypothetical protein
MRGTCTPRKRHQRLCLPRAAFVGAVLLVGACNFTVAGVDSHGTVDAGTTPPASTPPGVTPTLDLATPADLMTAPDLYTPMPDLLPLPDKVGDECAGSCGGGLTCMNWVPSGYCSESCDGSNNACPPGSSCVDTGGGSRYCLVNANGDSKCMRPDLSCRDCGASVCGPSSFCGGC